MSRPRRGRGRRLGMLYIYSSQRGFGRKGSICRVLLACAPRLCGEVLGAFAPAAAAAGRSRGLLDVRSLGLRCRTVYVLIAALLARPLQEQLLACMILRCVGVGGAIGRILSRVVGRHLERLVGQEDCVVVEGSPAKAALACYCSKAPGNSSRLSCH